MRHRRRTFRLPGVGRVLVTLSLLLFGQFQATMAGAAADAAVTGPVTLTNSVPDAVASGKATLVGALDQSQMLRLVLGLQPPNMAAEEQFLQQLQDKRSPLFHQYLTPDEWNARFAPSAQDEQAVADWAAAQGLSVTQRYPDRLLVDVAAPVGTIERAFRVHMNTYRLGTTTFYANDSAPTIPANLGGIMHAVLGLNSLEMAQPLITGDDTTPGPIYSDGPVSAAGGGAQRDGTGAAPPSASGQAQPATLNPNVTGGYYDPTDLYSSQAYDWQALGALGHCCNPFHNPSTQSPPATSIAIATSGAIQRSDMDGFVGRYNYLAYNYYVYYIDGTPACCNDETTLDTEWATAMANSFGSYHDTATVWVYEGADAKLSTFTDIYNFMLTDGHARSFSTSWGCTEFACADSGTMDTDHAIFNAMIGQGWTLSAATGDQGAYDDCTPNTPKIQYPSSDPDVLAVGGTALSAFGSFSGESAWTGPSYSCGGNKGGGGGGVSAYYGVPGYQAGMGFSGRATPDVSLNSAYGQNTYFNGAWHGYGGTSIAAPEVAGFIAQENAYLLAMGKVCGTIAAPVSCGTIGQANYAIYNSARGLGAGTPPHYPFYDVTKGCNGNGAGPGYCAGTGYDRATGWGSFNALQLAWALNWQTTPDNAPPAVTFSGASKNTWYNYSSNVYWTVADSGGVFGGAARPASGVAGFSAAWGSDPGDPNNPGHPGSGTAFYNGPQSPNATSGSLNLAAAGQGCHTANVRAWDNMGLNSGDQQYGPVCYDTITPHIDSVTLSPASPTNAASITTGATADDPGCGSYGSCVATIWYYVNTATDGTNSGTWKFLGTSVGASGSLTWSTAGLADGVHLVSADPMDRAGNFLYYVNDHNTARPLTLDKTAPVSTASPAGTPAGGGNYLGPVTVTLHATDNLSGVASTVYQLDGGAVTTYSGPFTVSALGAHTLTYHSTDKAGNVESARTTTFNVVNRYTTTTTPHGTPNPATAGQVVTLSATVSAISGIPTGSVTFTDGATSLGTASLVNGVATISTKSLAAGIHTITASYGGSSAYAPSSGAFRQIINVPTVSIFTTQTPTATQTGAYELGVKFRSSSAGHISGLRYYRPATETGTHTGHLWSATGALLGTVTFTNESASGWQTAYFATPIAVSANATYVASVNSNAAWAVTPSGLSAAVTNAPLATVADGDNGVYAGPGAFPVQNGYGANYFRDVVYTP